MSTFFMQYRLGAALVLAISACDSPRTEPSPASEIADSVAAIDSSMLAGLSPGISIDLLEEGRDLFVVCSVCHGLDGHGTQLGPSLRDSTWIHIPNEIDAIAEITRTGVPTPTDFPVPMPIMGGGDFDAGELRALATYVHALARSPS